MGAVSCPFLPRCSATAAYEIENAEKITRSSLETTFRLRVVTADRGRNRGARARGGTDPNRKRDGFRQRAREIRGLGLVRADDGQQSVWLFGNRGAFRILAGAHKLRLES